MRKDGAGQAKAIRVRALVLAAPQLGAEHFLRMRPHPSLVPHLWHPLRGIYVFQQAEPDYFDELNSIRTNQATVLWEISAESCRPQLLPTVTRLARSVDFFSINITEAQRLCSRMKPVECLKTLAGLGIHRISLRMGANGFLITDGPTILHIAAAHARAVVDPTGAGNCHSGALLAAWTIDQSCETAGRLASASASFAIEQYGPPPPASDNQLAARAAAVHVTQLHQESA